MRFNSTDQRCSSVHVQQQDGHDTISHAIYYGPSFSCYAAAVKLAFGSPRDEELLDGYIECDLLNNIWPGLAYCVLNSRARCIALAPSNLRGLIEGAVYSKGANYSRKYGSIVIKQTLYLNLLSRYQNSLKVFP